MCETYAGVFDSACCALRTGDNSLGNLKASSFGAEQISGSNWFTAGFRTDSSGYVLSSVTALIEQDMPGTLNLALYANTTMQPPNQLGNLAVPAILPSFFGRVTFSGNHLMLAPNTTYWIVMGTPVSSSYEWAFEDAKAASGVGFYSSWGMSQNSGNSWFTNAEQPMQMSVIGTPIPQPVTVWPVLLGGAALTGTRFRNHA